ncbi:MAG: PQQ-binding-like beta-propeller repeat protein [Bryobacterales bacterium]|nr:PQQ-binding-like beta-propeller repeat protein [Bryobacterales bacterium]
MSLVLSLRPAFVAAAVAALLVAEVRAQDWPQFRGPERDGIVPGVETVEAFPRGGPDLLWERSVGSGFSAPVVTGEQVLLFHRRGAREIVEALRASDGEQLWETGYQTTYKDDFGFENGPRATPVVNEGRVYTFGAAGTLTCFALDSGESLWSVDTHRKYRVRKGFFGAASTPVVIGQRVIANVGGPDGAGVVAFDASSGTEVWRATDHDASYSSPIVAHIDGRPAAVFFTREGLAVLATETGDLLYEQRWRSRSRASVNAATPIALGNVVFLTASYGTGAIAMRLAGGQVEELWSGEGVLDMHYSSPVRSGGTIFGFHGRQEYGQQFRAADLISGEVLWSSNRLPAGSVTRVGDRLLLLLETGELLLADASRETFEVAARAQILAGETRAFPAFAGGKMYARDKDTLVCLRLWQP